MKMSTSKTDDNVYEYKTTKRRKEEKTENRAGE